MPSQEKINANRKMFSELFLEQVKPYMTGIPTVWAKQFGETVTFGDAFGASAKARFLPFAKNTMRTDCRVFHKFPTALGEVIAVLHFSAFAVQPTDFIFILNRCIPRAAYLRKAKGSDLTDRWATTLTEGGNADPFADYLTGLERKKGILPDSPHYYANWVFHLGKLAVEVPYTMALIPLGDARTIFLFKCNAIPGFFSVKKINFDIELVWRIAAWIDEALGELNYQGDLAPLEVPIPAVSLIAIPEIAPMFEYQGVDIALNVDLTRFSASAVQQSINGSPSASSGQDAKKYCIQCGEAIPMDAAFCSKCGAKQG
jgi:ribosomal protein L40E